MARRQEPREPLLPPSPPTPDPRQPPPDHRQPPPDHRQPPPDHRQPPPDHRQPPPDHRQPPSDHRQPPPDHRQPPPDHRQPPPAHRQPPTDHRQAPRTTDDENEIEVFQDAEETAQMDLHTAFRDCEMALHRFFSNQITEAVSIMKPWSTISVYHALGTSIFDFIPAILTLDGGRIARSQTSLKNCISLCLQQRKNQTIRQSIGAYITRLPYATYTDLQAHTELIYAEALLLQTALSVLDTEDITGIIRSSLKIKTCYNLYKDCSKILQQKKWDSEESRHHFESGTRLGLAAFNVLISLLPPRVITLLQFVGFSANKEYGLNELYYAARSPGLRSLLCGLFLLGYNLIICHFIGIPGNLRVVEEILQRELQVYPDGIWFVALAGRYHFLLGEYDLAEKTYKRAMTCDKVWPQFHHLCYWELMWVHAVQLDWLQAAFYADKLVRDSNWSKTVYCYCKGAWLLMLKDLTPEQKKEVDIVFKNAEKYKRRIAGKSLPMEKFAISRCQRYKAQGGRLLLPGYELLVAFNMLPIIHNGKKGPEFVALIDQTRDSLARDIYSWNDPFEADNRALLHYLQGATYTAMNLPNMAIEHLDSVLSLKPDLIEDTHLIPYAMIEMAVNYHVKGDSERCFQLLEDARKKHSGYYLEPRLQFRLQAKMEIIKDNRPYEFSPLV